MYRRRRRGGRGGKRGGYATHAQMLIFRGRSWKKNMSWMNIMPPPWVTVEKKPLSTRAAMKLLKLVAAAHHAAVAVAMHRK